MRRGLVILLVIAEAVTAWSEYEAPLVEATPDEKTGIYYFEWIVEETMTMATSGVRGEGFFEVVDYVVNETDNPWRVRISEFETHCADAVEWNNDKHNFSSLLQLDGRHQVVFTINGKTPADPIVVPLGAEIQLTVRNHLMATDMTMHVHGLNMRGNWFNDGIPFLQQCPIQAKSSHVYRIFADTIGTHWVHGHLGVDRGQGLLGAFIVTEGGKRDIREYAMVLQDWFANDWKHIWLLKKWGLMKWHRGLENPEHGSQCHQPTYTHDNGDLFADMALQSLLVNTKGWHNQSDVLHHPEKLPLTQFRIKQDSE
uniref:Plastocyanin-like domain-containing protein n=1 Tax=Panagrellus redivivus TaxID=6233 RepID=A0A7E4WCD3_PANRE